MSIMKTRELPFANEKTATEKAATPTSEYTSHAIYVREECDNNAVLANHPVDSMPNDAKNVLIDRNGKLYVRACRYGSKSPSEQFLMYDIVNVKVHQDTDGNDCAVTVFFGDNTSQSAAVSHGDTFSLEHGISICIMKHLLSFAVKAPYMGTALYNKVMNRVEKAMKRNNEMKIRTQNELLDKEKRYMKLVEKKRRRKEKRREQEIEMRKEAYKRAIRELTAEGNRV